MKFPLFRRRPSGQQTVQGTISALYGMIVAQARLPCFYRDYAVADTVNGRFDMIVLHLALLLDRLGQAEGSRGLGQGVFDRFCQDMEHNLREMGIADLKVPQEMQRMGEAYCGRAQAYQVALAAAEPGALAEALSRNIYGGAPSEPGAPARLAAYIRLAVGHLRGQSVAQLAAGEMRLPDPETAFKATA